jgi:polyisoprenoid-binding protein YceI
LTIRGETHPLTLELEYGGVVTDPYGNEKAVFAAETKIDREDWGLTWNAPLEAGGWLVGKEVKIEIEAELAKA